MKRGHWYPTGFDWYTSLAALPPFDEIGFWQPGGNTSIDQSHRGTPFIFKRSSPMSLEEP